MSVTDGKNIIGLEGVVGCLHGHFSESEVKALFESGRLPGRKIDGEWHAERRDVEEFFNRFVEDRSFITDVIRIGLGDVLLDDWTLDIGGGGEGVIGQLSPTHVIAIDLSREELEEAGCDCVKAVMDARDLSFTDGTFQYVTAFFSFMYMDRSDQRKSLQEAHRVLKDGGELQIWDAMIPMNDAGEKKYFVAKVEVDIGSRLISTRYGTIWNKTQDAGSIIGLATSAGFSLSEKRDLGDAFYIRFKK